MGAPMSLNLVKAGFSVKAYDLVEEKLDALVPQGVHKCHSHAQAIENADAILTMLPTSVEVKDVYQNHVLPLEPTQSILIDCSTIDLTDAKELHQIVQSQGFSMLDAPVSGGTVGAANGTLTFMVGGSPEHIKAASALFDAIGESTIHCGEGGMGQAAKMCNNMMLGIQMASVAEGFKLAQHCGLTSEKLFEVATQSSGNCFSLTTFCPIPNIVPTSPSSNDYQPGFSTGLMLKDMNLALNAAKNANLNLQTATVAKQIYQSFSDQGNGHKDFSAVFTSIQPSTNDESNEN